MPLGWATLGCSFEHFCTTIDEFRERVDQIELSSRERECITVLCAKHCPNGIAAIETT
jgi:hypothetical protein